jgi:hypothetical protein
MKLLVAGDSIPAGYGFELGKQEPSLWPNQLSHRLGAELTNISVPGYDNTGILLNTLSSITASSYDLILVQLTSINRLILSPGIHGIINATTQHSVDENWKFLINDSDYKHFYKTLTLLNNDFEHWNRLAKGIYILQNLSKQTYNIRIVNGILNWNQETFKNKYSQWAKNIIDHNHLPNQEIEDSLDIIHQQLNKIDMSIWINPYISLLKMQIDNASATDCHPGSKSHDIYTDLIYNSITNERKHHGQAPTSCKP